jgi:hypothetical protein
LGGAGEGFEGLVVDAGSVEELRAPAGFAISVVSLTAMSWGQFRFFGTSRGRRRRDRR